MLALGAEVAEKDIMERAPRRSSDMFSKQSVFSVILFGVIQTLIVVGTFIFSVNTYGNQVAVTITFFVLSFLELFHAFNIRTDKKSAFGRGFFENKIMFLTVIIGIVVNLLLCFIPILSNAFGIVPLNAFQWAVVFASSLSIVPIGEIYKLILRKIVKE